jgi:hypothetical protein
VAAGQKKKPWKPTRVSGDARTSVARRGAPGGARVRHARGRDRQPRRAGSRRGKPDLKLGLTTYSTRELSLDQTIALMQRLALRHVSLKDVHLALDSSPTSAAPSPASCRTRG